MFDPSKQQAAEALAVDLTNGVVDASAVELTKAQDMLKISPELVYLCGLAVCVCGDHCKNEFFRELQQKYHAEQPITRMYKFSPSLIPSNDVLQSIQTDLTRKETELAKLAAETAQQLLREEESKRKRGTRKKKQAPKVIDKVEQEKQESDALNEQENEPPQETLEDLMFLNTTTVEENGSEADDWTQVTKKKQYQSEEAERKQQADHVEDCRVQPVREKKQSQTEIERSRQDEHVTVQAEPAVEVKVPKQLETPNLSTETETNVRLVPEIQQKDDSVDDNNEEICLLQARVAKLETELQLEREAHHLTKERCDEQMQALQLRLYIAETRLKTFEDALQQHNEAVANNTASSPMPRKEERHSLVLGHTK